MGTAHCPGYKDTMYKHAIEGFTGCARCSARGGAANLSDDDVKAAVDFHG